MSEYTSSRASKVNREPLFASITISRTSSNMHEEQVVRIEIKDELSGVRLAVVEVPMASFASAVTGLGAQAATIMHRPTVDTYALVGKVRKLKHMGVMLDKSRTYGAYKPAAVGYIRDQAYAALIAEVGESEPNAWRLCDDGLGTQQNGKLWNVSFERFDDPTEEDIREAKQAHQDRM